MNVDGSLNFDTNVNTKGFSKGTNNIKEKLKGMKSAVLKFGTAVTAAFSVKELVNFGRTAIESAAEINAANSQMSQTFGSLYSSADEAMKRVAETSGIVQTRLQGVGTSIYAFAKTSGMDSASALKMMEEALQVTADSAAYYDRSLEETSESLKSFLKGNYANDAALGLSCTETTRNTAANRLYGKSFQELSESQKQLTLLQMVKDANALSGAEGQAAREADGWENVIGNLKETWKQFMAVVGKPMLNVAVSAVKQLTEALTFLTEKARSAVNALSELFGWETDDSETVSLNISESVEEQNALTEAVEKTTETQENSLAGFDKINTITQKTAESAKPTESKEIPIKPAVVTDKSETEKEVNKFAGKIQELIKPVQLAWEANSPELISNVKTAFENIRGLAGSIADSLEEVWTNGSGERYIGNIITLFSDFFGIVGDIAGALKNAWNDENRGTDLIQSYFDRWNSLFELIHSVNTAFREVWNDGAGEEICANIFGIVTDINNIFANLHERFTDAWNANKTGVRIFKAILGIVNIILKTVKRLTGKTAEWAGNLDFSPMLESVADFFESLEPLAENVGDIFSDIYEKVLLPIGSWTIEKVVPASIDLFSGAVDALNSVIEVFKPFGKWLYDKFLKPVAEWTGGVIVSVIKSLADALKGVSDWISEHQTLVQNFLILIGSIGAAFAISGIIQTVISAFTAMGGVMGILVAAELGLQTVTTALAGAFTFLTSPIVLIPLLIGAVIAAGVLLIKHWDEVKAFASGVWESIQETLYSFFEVWETGWNSIVDFMGTVWEKITGFFSDAWNVITGIFQNIGAWFSDRWKDIKNALSDISKWFGNMFRKAYTKVTEAFKNIGKWFSERWNDVTSALSDVGDWFGEKFRSAWDSITGIFRNIGSWFAERWNDIVNVFSGIGGWFWDKFLFAWDNITAIFCGIGEFFRNRWNDITNAFSAVGTWFGDIFSGAWNNITTAFSGVKGFFEEVWNGITSVFSHVTNWFRDTFSSAWEAVRNVFSKGGEIFTGITDGIFNTFKTIVNGLIDGINGVIKQPFDAINWAIDEIRYIAIAGWYPFYWLPSIDVPQIPYLAQGTVVPANYGNFLAVLGDNKREMEVVSPLSTIEKAVTNAMNKNGGFGNGEIHVHVELDGREIGRVAVRAVNQDRIRRGG